MVFSVHAPRYDGLGFGRDSDFDRRAFKGKPGSCWRTRTATASTICATALRGSFCRIPLRKNAELGDRSHRRCPAHASSPASSPVSTARRCAPPPLARQTGCRRAFNPDSSLFYVVAQESCAVATKSTETFPPRRLSISGHRRCGDAGRLLAHARSGADLATGKIVWDHEEVGAHGYGAGVLSTAGGLLFVGDDQGEFVALDARTGKPVWHFNVGQRISSSP